MPLLARLNSNSRNSPLSPAKVGGHHVRSASYSGLMPERKGQHNAARAAAAIKLAEAMNARYEVDDNDEVDDLHYNVLPRQKSTPTPITPVQPFVLNKSPELAQPMYNDTKVIGAWAASTRLSNVTPCPAPIAPSTIPNTQRRSSAINARPLAAPEKTPERVRKPSMDLSTFQAKIESQTSAPRREIAELNDQVDSLQEEKDTLIEKLRTLEVTLEREKTRSRELEKQVEKQIPTIGDGLSLESRHKLRVEQARKQRDAEALMAANNIAREDNGNGEAKEEEALRTVTDHVSVADAAELKVLQSVARRMSLTNEEREDMILKRCWIARYWALAHRYGAHPDVAHEKHEHWSSIARRPLETVILAGELAKQEAVGLDRRNGSGDHGPRMAETIHVDEAQGDGDLETLLLVEKALQELAFLRVEEIVLLCMAQRRHTTAIPPDLTPEEVEEVKFKLAWLTYFWRRAKSKGLQDDIADERLQHWITRSNEKHPTTHDLVDVTRGLLELRKEGIEQQLWLASRKPEISKH